ncbi:MAG TPA: hypothetical protein ENN46_01020 [Candidatus Woesearchaeota archaeon]|nr:hypothetical protein [Candidatus Woesearchaeota archaeon]
MRVFDDIDDVIEDKKGRAIKILLTVVLILIPMLLAVFLRAQPAYLPITDDWARDSIYNSIGNQIYQQVNAQYPLLPEQQKRSLAQEQLDQFIKNNKDELDREIKAYSLELKERLKEDEGNITYLTAIDPYHYFRLTRNIVELGHPGDTVLDDGRNVDYLMLGGAPIERKPTYQKRFTNLLELINANAYRLLRFLGSDVTLLQVFFFSPVLLSVLCVIPAFFIGKRLAGNIGGFFAGAVVAIHPFFISRTIGGFADTDAFNVLFPLIAAWMLIEAFRSRSTRNTIVFSVLTAATLWIYSTGWTPGPTLIVLLGALAANVGLALILYNTAIFKENKKGKGYIFIAANTTLLFAMLFTVFFFDKSMLPWSGLFPGAVTGVAFLVFLSAILSGLIYLCSEIFASGLKIDISSKKQFFRKEAKITLLILGVFFVSYFLMSSYSLRSGGFNFGNMINNIRATIGFVQIKDVATASIWPNVYTTVAELKEASFSQIMDNLGGQFLFVIALIGIGFALFAKGRGKSNTALFSLLLALWMASTVYATFKGIRFVLMIVPPFAIAIGVALGLGGKYLAGMLEKNFQVKSSITKLILVALFVVVLFFGADSMYSNAYRLSSRQFPMMNDGWYNTLAEINEKADEDAIITSWWDFGHWFKAIARRQVTFDGASQNTPMAHWAGRILQTDDETEALAIQRMLNCGSNEAFYILEENLTDSAAIRIVKDIIMMPREDARQHLLNHVSEDAAEQILQYSHCTPPQSFFITSEDMVGKSGVWGHFGTWNFTRSTMYNRIRFLSEDEALEILMDYFNLSDELANRYYNQIRVTDNADQWVSPWPSYVGSEIGCTRKNNDTLECTRMFSATQGVKVFINLASMEAYVNQMENRSRPHSFMYYDEDGNSYVKEYDSPVLDLSVTLKERADGSYQIIVGDPLLRNSIFTRLFFLEGHGTKYFEQFSNIRDVFGQRVIVWTIDWESFLEDFEG